MRQTITFEMSNGLERKFEDMSQTKGTPFVSGTNGNSTPTDTKVKARTLQKRYIIIKNNSEMNIHNVINIHNQICFFAFTL